MHSPLVKGWRNLHNEFHRVHCTVLTKLSNNAVAADPRNTARTLFKLNTTSVQRSMKIHNLSKNTTKQWTKESLVNLICKVKSVSKQDVLSVVKKFSLTNPRGALWIWDPLSPISLIFIAVFGKQFCQIRMHSSRMRSARGSSHPWGSASVHAGTHNTPLGVGLDTTLGVGLETPRCGPGNPPGQTPQLPPWVWTWRLPQETCKACWYTTCKACWDTTPLEDLLQGMLGYHLQCMLGYHPLRLCTESQTRVKT